MSSEKLEVEMNAIIGKTIMEIHNESGQKEVGVVFTDGAYCVFDKNEVNTIQLMAPWDIRPSMQIKLGMATLEDFAEEEARIETAERARYEELKAKFGGE